MEKFIQLASAIKKCQSSIRPDEHPHQNDLVGLAFGRVVNPPGRTSVRTGRQSSISIVAVTVDMAEDKLRELLAENLIDVLQFHGHETPEFCDQFRNKVEVWRSFKIQTTDDRRQTIEILEKFKGKIDRSLLDAASAEDKANNRNNQFKDFKLFKDLQARGYPLVLAGGINPDNVELYINKLNPEIIDVASGIEERPGKKSPEKMKKFMEKIKHTTL